MAESIKKGTKKNTEEGKMTFQRNQVFNLDIPKFPEPPQIDSIEKLFVENDINIETIELDNSTKHLRAHPNLNVSIPQNNWI